MQSNEEKKNSRHKVAHSTKSQCRERLLRRSLRIGKFTQSYHEVYDSSMLLLSERVKNQAQLGSVFVKYS